MAHASFGCPHQTLPQRFVQSPVRKFATRQQLASTLCDSLPHSGCPEQKFAQQQSLRSTRVAPRQLTKARLKHHKHFLACCAQGHSGSLDSSFDASSQTAAEASQDPKDSKVPWGLKEFVSVILLWFFAFWCLGYFILPGAMGVFGADKDDLSITQQALYHVFFDLGQLFLTIRILIKQLKSFKPRRLGWFNAQFRPVKPWLQCVLLGTVTFPFLDWAAQLSQKWFPDDLWTLNLEQSIVRGDYTSNVLYFAVLIFCAPIWEEAMFRGFMLPSFNKFMPKIVALLLTSAIFAMLHFSVQRFIPLVLLGVVLGLVYMRTRNLLAPISLHALWNMYIFYNLLMRGSGILGRLSVFMF